MLDRVEVKDRYNGTIVLKEPFAPLWTISLVRGSGSVLSKEAMESVGGKFTTEPPAGSGPYVLKEWQPKQRTILARNPDFYGVPPDFTGELDYTTISLSSLPKLEANLPAEARLDVGFIGSALDGDSGNNTIDGGSGDDEITGAAGNDI